MLTGPLTLKRKPFPSGALTVTAPPCNATNRLIGHRTTMSSPTLSYLYSSDGYRNDGRGQRRRDASRNDTCHGETSPRTDQVSAPGR
jgi:hypothetical protein